MFAEEARNPNEAKYFSEEKGCTLNKDCDDCGKRIWVQDAQGTNYHGKKFLHSKTDQIMSIVFLESNEKGEIMRSGAACVECFEKNHKKRGLYPDPL